ncbi:MAG: AraC family transcriptional regulator [bacterium]|jgi:AraC-like DNA-binding protein|nr:AraC family transcriptional regulator [bacterium]MDD3805871.1 AraC family transcriptional regulator [bacterium]MDD4152502.1 AraC family transcriptional regulator [bacterium]MDD4558230.1 AraC family transcriptional regulator [bacterium]
MHTIKSTGTTPGKRRIYRSIDLHFLFCGMEACTPSHSFGPAVRGNYLIHLIINGKGIFRLGDQIWELHQGQGFLIYPDVLTYYEADAADPWTYAWLGFGGIMAADYLAVAGLSKEKPIVNFDTKSRTLQLLLQMQGAIAIKQSDILHLQGMLNLFISSLMDEASQTPAEQNEKGEERLYVNWARNFIEANYYKRLRIADIAAQAGLNRSYFCRIFKEGTGLPPMSYLLNVRMRRAANLLKSTELTVNEVAVSVGYGDQLVFSKAFRKTYGCSPLAYRACPPGVNTQDNCCYSD